MRIADVEVRESRLPKIDKDWKFALAAMPVQEGWVAASDMATLRRCRTLVPRTRWCARIWSE